MTRYLVWDPDRNMALILVPDPSTIEFVEGPGQTLLIRALSGGGGGGLSGSGTAGRVAEWVSTSTLQNSTLVKSGAGVLTLSAAGAYTLTVPATGIAALLDYVNVATDYLEISTASILEPRGIVITETGAAGSALFIRRNSGSAITIGQTLGRIFFDGWDGSAFGGSLGGTSVRAVANENWNGTSKGSRIEFLVTPNTLTTQFVAAIINNDGGFTFSSPTGFDQGIILDSTSSAKNVQFIFRSAGVDKWYLRKNTSEDFDLTDGGGNLIVYVQRVSKNIGLGGASSWGASAVSVVSFANGTAPTTSITGTQIWSEPTGLKIMGSGSTGIATIPNAVTGTIYLSSGTDVAITDGGTGASTAVAGKDNLSPKSSDIASASTTDLSTATGDFVDITGTTTITAFGTLAAGVERTLRFTGALTLTHNATSLILPGAANITTANGDTAIMRSLGSGNWKCISYQYGASAPYNGAVFVQVVNTETGAVATGTTTVPQDDTIPQNTEGDQYMSLSITPKNTANKLIIDVVFVCSLSIVNHTIVSLFQDTTASALASVIQYQTTASGFSVIVFRHFMAAGTTSSTTFKVRAGPAAAGTLTFNGQTGARVLGGVIASSITIGEYVA